MQLGTFIGATLQRLGGVAEADGDDRLRVLLPGPIAASLDLREESRLRLGGQAGPQEAYAGYGSELLSRLCSMASGGARRFRIELALPLPKRERVEREAEEALRFQNATARVEAIGPETLEYAIFDFRYTALSQDRQEGLLSVAINADGGWCPGLGAALPACLDAHPDARWPWSGQDPEIDPRAHYRAERALADRQARAEVGPFIPRMERRLGRDVRRIDVYYAALRQEIEGRASRHGPDVLREKLEAIEAERRRRRQDLVRRHAVNLRVEPLGILVLRVSGLSLRARLRRRRNDAPRRLGWNPIARRFDAWLCAACGGEAGVPYVCDRLHLLCASCPPDCPVCGHARCAACGDRCRCPGPKTRDA